MCKNVTSLVSLLLAMAQISYAGLVAHWDLEEGSGAATTAAVGSPQADGAFVGATWITTGLAPMEGTTAAVFFNSANRDRIETNYPGVLGQAARSVTAWVRVDPAFKNNGCIAGWGVDAATQRYSLRLNTNASNGRMRALRLEINGSRSVATTPINDGQWHHVAVTHDAGALISAVTFYLDGKVDAQSGTGGGGLIDTANGTVVIGNSGHNTGTFGFDGAIDEVRIYDHVLSAAEIKSLASRPRAFAPDPADGAIRSAAWTSLSWSRGDFAVSHDVYIGDNFADVNAGAANVFRGNQTATNMLVGLPGYPFPDGLVPGTTYYWRIDEVNTADPGSPRKGSIWRFSIPPRTAYNPNPADAADAVALDGKLTWTAGFGAKLHTIYFGDSFDDVNNASSGGFMAGLATYSPPGMKAGKVYYWRVDETDPPNTHKGWVWSFTTVGAVGGPHPSNGNPSAEMNAILTWTPGAGAASHEVYFGMDKDAVRKAGTTSPEYKGVRALGAESYDLGLLPRDNTYYWRVDEVNAVNPNSPWKGPLWSFTTGDFLLVDDFESYNNIDPPAPGNHRIFETWLDGFGTTTNGALVGNNLPPYAEQTIVHSGKQSMPLAYDNNLKYSEVTMTLAGAARDWTAQGVTELSLWFRGLTANAAERMYVALNGTTVVYHDNPNVAQTARWTEWVIPLQQFAGSGVNLTNVTSITIGFGTRGTTTVVGGTGKMYFDDIRLSQPRTAP